MKIFKVLVTYSESGAAGRYDAIEYQGKTWIVPRWINSHDTRTRKPARIVHVGRLGTPTASGRPQDALLLPLAVIEGRIRPKPPIEVMEYPDIQLPMPETDLH